MGTPAAIRCGTPKPARAEHAYARVAAAKRWRARRLRDTSSGVMEEGRLVRYQGTLVDVTEKRALESSAPAGEFQRHLLESFPDLILVLDLKGKYTFVSPRQLPNCSAPRASSWARTWKAREHTSPRARALPKVATGESALGSVRYGLGARDGSWRVLGVASPLLDAKANRRLIVWSAM